VRLFGIDACQDMNEIRKRIGVVFQSPSHDKQLTAEENLRHHGHLYGIGRRGARKNGCKRLLERRGICWTAEGARSTGFSGGMRRRVELPRGLLNRPRSCCSTNRVTGLDPGGPHRPWRTLCDIPGRRRHDPCSRRT